MIGSIAVAALRAYWLLLSPSDVLHGAIWQLVTFAFIETSPLSLVFGALILVSLGGTLETWWGGRRVVQLLLGATVASGVITTLLALAVPALRTAYFAGGGALVSAAWCAFGWTLGRARSTFYGISVTGDQLALIGIGFVVLRGAYGAWHDMIPEAIAITLVYAYLRRGRP